MSAEKILDEYGYRITLKEKRERDQVQAKVDDWNAKYPVGTTVLLETYRGGPKILTTTRTPAWRPSHDSKVAYVSVEGKTGGWCLDFVEVPKDLEEAVRMYGRDSSNFASRDK